ncbi:VOC family protein [Nonomuraea typhae]|uniref:VOC family protein n=1 Tax=Nonomuraea typhae TaxID=2603600 RepID=A0ABW7Z348_9ACTN
MDSGNVVWFEISAAVKDFYGRLLGWGFALDPDSSAGGVTYTRIMAPGREFPMGAVYEGPGMEAPNVSIVSADVAADQARLEKLGATVVVPATQVSDVTTFARLADPQGNVFSLFQNDRTPERLREFSGRAREQMSAAPVPGAYAWFEIGTGDVQATREFYGQAFGWTIVLDDSAGGKPYANVFTGDDRPTGGVYEQGVDYLMPCFLVTDVPATTARAVDLGARVEFGPDANPDGLVYARLIDPRGGRFGVFSTPAAS